MSKLLISTGTNPNDGNGDTLLAGAGKVNSNFNEIYSSLGNGNDISIGAGKTVISTNSLGNVGVGTTDASDKLHTLGGNIRVDSLTGQLNFWNGASYYGGIGVAGGMGGSGTDIVIRSEPTKSIIFYTDGANDRGRIDSGGNFLVGTSSSTGTGTTSQPLQVTGGVYVSGSVGIGTTNPDKSLHIYTADGDIRIGDITEGTATTDAGVIFTGLGSNRSGLFTEVNGTLLSYGINCQQITGVETGRSGGVFRFDTRTSGSFNGSNCFAVVGKPIGTTTEYSALVVGLNDGNTYLSPTRGNVLVGSSSSTGTASQPLQVTGGGYFSGNVAIGETIAVGQLHLSSAGPLIVGTGSSTGTATQRLQVTGGGYISGNLGVGAATTNPTSILHLGAGTASNAQLEFTSGSLLTSAAAGIVEYDGTTFFATPNTSYGRASIPTTIYTSGAGTVLTLLSEATTQPLFPSANDTISLPIGTYRIELAITMTRAAASTSAATLNITLNGSGSGSVGTFSGLAIGNVGTGSTTILISASSITASTPISASNNQVSTSYSVLFTGILRITTAGTFQPRYSLSSNLTGATGANTISAANYMILQSISTSGSTASTGAWA